MAVKKSNIFRYALLVVVLGIAASLSILSTPPPVKAATIEKSGTLTGDETWTADNVYRIVGDLIIPADVTLTIEADTSVKFQYTSDEYGKRLLVIHGTLDLQGTAANPVFFTSDRDDSDGHDTNGDGSSTSPAKGDWGYIKFTNPNASNVFEHAVVRFGGRHRVNSYTFEHYMLWVEGTAVVIRSNVIEHSYRDGIRFNASAQGGSVTYNDITNNNNAGVIVLGDGTNLEIQNNNIEDNTNYGVYSSVPVEAVFNWWGDSSGPYHPTLNTDGLGDEASDNVNFSPWLTEHVQIKPSSAQINVYPQSIPADDASTAEIQLIGAEPGHLIRLEASLPGTIITPSQGTTDEDGDLSTSIRSSVPGDAIITAKDLSTNSVIGASTSVTFTPIDGEDIPPADQGVISILRVRSQRPLDGMYFPGIAIPNEIEVVVGWNGTSPDRVDFILNGNVFSETTFSDNVSHSFDMGNDLQAGENTLQIIAYNADGQASEERSYIIRQPDKPGWLLFATDNGIFTNLLPGGFEGGASIDYGFVYPYQDLGLFADNFGVPGTKTGLPIRVEGFVSLPLTCSTPLEGTLAVSERNKFEFLGAKIGASLEGTLSGEHGPDCTLLPPTGSWKLEVDAERNLLKRTWIDMLQYYNYALYISVDGIVEVLHIRTSVEKIGELSIDGIASVQAGSQFYTANGDPQWAFQDLEIGVGGGIKSSLTSDILVAEVELFAGGTVKGYFVRPGLINEQSSWDFDRLEIKGEAGAKFRVGWFVREAKGEIVWVYPVVNQVMINAPMPVDKGEWQLIRAAETDASYQKLDTKAGFSHTPFALSSSERSAATVAAPLVTNVFPYPEPEMEMRDDDQGLLLWNSDDVSQPVGQGYDLTYSRWNGSTWSTPTKVVDDSYPDAGSEVVWLADGNALAAWERLDDPALPIDATLDITQTKKMEIAWATYDATADTWSAPAWLTQHAEESNLVPVLSQAADGSVWAAWRNNTAGQLNGDSANPDRIQIAQWNGSGWNATQTAVTDIPGIVDLDMAHNGSNDIVLTWTANITPTGSVTPTLQLLTSSYDGAAWSAPLQITDDSEGHTNPQLIYRQGQPYVVWLAGDTLTLQNLSALQMQRFQANMIEAALAAGDAIILPEDIQIDQFRVLQDSQENLFAVFTGSIGPQRDLFLSYYDSSSGGWGLPQKLSDDADSEKYPAADLNSDDNLLAAYSLTEILDEEQTMIDPETGETITYTLRVDGQTDLFTMSHLLRKDLAAETLLVSDDHPDPGSTVVITGTLENRGDVPLNSIDFVFKDDGATINSQVVAGPLVAGEVVTLTHSFQVPDTGGIRTLTAAADPNDAIQEIDETNNIAALQAFGPDLQIVQAGVEYGTGSLVDLVNVVENIGTTTSPAAEIAYYHEAITGTLAITDTLPAIGAGESVELITPWDYGSLAEGAYDLAVVANKDEADFAELFMANNIGDLTLDVLPDLGVSPYYVWSAPQPGGSIVIMATVYNYSSVASPASQLDIYADDVLSDAAKIGTIAIPALDPAGYALLNTTWDTPTPGDHTFYVEVNGEQLFLETTWANNVASTAYSIVEQAIPLESGWNLVSGYVSPADPALSAVFAGIADKLVLVKNGRGEVYWPAYGVDQIGVWNPLEGYQVLVSEGATLTLNGMQLNYLVTTADLGAGWNVAGYWRDEALPVETALAGLAEELVLAKNGDGQVYWPAFEIDNIGNMVPGQGYKIYLSGPKTLDYSDGN